MPYRSIRRALAGAALLAVPGIAAAQAPATRVDTLAVVDSTVVVDSGVPEPLVGFEARRRRALGRYLTPADLERAHGRSLADALKPILLGAGFERTSDGQEILVNGRYASPLGAVQQPNARGCGVQVWVDGVMRGDANGGAQVGGTIGGSDPDETRSVIANRRFNFAGLVAGSFLAAEYYPDLATTPAAFHAMGSTCGTLVLWTKDAQNTLAPPLPEPARAAPSATRRTVRTAATVVGGAAVGAWLGYFAAQVVHSDWEQQSSAARNSFRRRYVITGAALGAIAGLLTRLF